MSESLTEALMARPQMLTPSQVAERLNVSKHTAYRMLAAHRLPGVKIGGQWRTHPVLLDRWVDVQVRASMKRGQAR